MVLPLLLSLALASPSAQADDPPVRLWLSSDGHFRIADRARVYVETADDGYLVVLRADAEGRVRVLYPVDPDDDNFVRGGKKFEIRWRGVREAFYVEDLPGTGVVVAAWSRDPFKFDAFVRNEHWDYRVLGATKLTDDPEAGLLDIAGRMAGGEGGRFEHDAATYTVAQPWRDNFNRAGWWGDPWPYRLRLGLTPFGYNACYDPFWGYDPFYCSGFGFGYTGFYYRPVYRRPVFVGGFGYRSVSAPRFAFPRDRVSVPSIAPRRRTSSGGGFSAPPRARGFDRGIERRSVTRSVPRFSPPPRMSGGGGGRGGAVPRSRRH